MRVGPGLFYTLNTQPNGDSVFQNNHNNSSNKAIIGNNWINWVRIDTVTAALMQSTWPDVNLVPYNHRAVIGSAEVEVGSACQRKCTIIAMIRKLIQIIA